MMDRQADNEKNNIKMKRLLLKLRLWACLIILDLLICYFNIMKRIKNERLD